MITLEQCRSARAWLNWSQDELAGRAKVAPSTVRDFEAGRHTPFGNNMTAIEAALAAGGIYPVTEHGEPSGIRYEHRIKESHTYLPMLEILDEAPDGFMSTSDLILALERRLEPQGGDVAILAGRSDTRFSQIVRNIVSHKDTASNPIHKGWVEYDKAKRGLRITTAGRKQSSAKPAVPLARLPDYIAP